MRLGSLKPVKAPPPLNQYFNTDRSKAVLLLWFLTVTGSCYPYFYVGSPIMRVTYLGRWMTTCLGKSCWFDLLRVPFVNCCQFMYLVISLGFEGKIWDLIVSVPDHCLSFYFVENIGSWKLWQYNTFGRRNYEPACSVFHLLDYIMFNEYGWPKLEKIPTTHLSKTRNVFRGLVWILYFSIILLA